jgi:Asp-tRNA(Asn)/Glu-tRNA(Gln) amidotransferase C subunit
MKTPEEIYEELGIKGRLKTLRMREIWRLNYEDYNFFELNDAITFLLKNTKCDNKTFFNLPFHKVFIECCFPYKSGYIFGISILHGYDKEELEQQKKSLQAIKNNWTTDINEPYLSALRIEALYYDENAVISKNIIERYHFDKPINIVEDNTEEEKEYLSKDLERIEKYFPITKNIFRISINNNHGIGKNKLEIFDDKKNDKINKKYSEIWNFVEAFQNFINSDDIRYFPINLSDIEKKNKRREKKGKTPYPKNLMEIKINGYLKDYLNEIESGKIYRLSCKFIVRGHYIHFWNKQKYKNIYKKFDEGKLENKGNAVYQLTNERILKRWVMPYVKGQGLLIKKRYSLE